MTDYWEPSIKKNSNQTNKNQPCLRAIACCCYKNNNNCCYKLNKAKHVLVMLRMTKNSFWLFPLNSHDLWLPRSINQKEDAFLQSLSCLHEYHLVGQLDVQLSNIFGWLTSLNQRQSKTEVGDLLNILSWLTSFTSSNSSDDKSWAPGFKTVSLLTKLWSGWFIEIVKTS